MLFVVLNLLMLWSVEATVCPRKPLNDGNLVPVVAHGTFGQINRPDKIIKSVVTAVEAGYRYFDTGAYYLNEVYVGLGLARAMDIYSVPRHDLFVSTKLDPRVNSDDGVLESLQSSLQRLKLEYVDLFLIHMPVNVYNLATYNDVVSIWRGMEKVQKLGLAKSIGVSNFNSTQINQILAACSVVPAVNEIEVNPTYTNLDLVAYCESQNISVHAYAPFGYTVKRQMRPDVNPRPPPYLNDPLLLKLAKKYRATTPQVLLRYLLDRGLVAIPKAYTPRHIRENIDIFDFSLTEQEVRQINNYNRDYKVYLFDLQSLNYLAHYAYNVDFAESLGMI